MRRLIMAAAILSFMLSLWTLPAYAQAPEGIIVPSRCCQYGVTYGKTEFQEAPYCEEVPDTLTCGKGGTTVSGTCKTEANGYSACTGAEVCCQGVSIGEKCQQSVVGGEYTAEPDSCAEAKESKCDAKSAAGETATQSVPGGTCEDNACVVVEPPPP